MPLPRGSLISFERRAEKISAAGSKHRLPITSDTLPSFVMIVGDIDDSGRFFRSTASRTRPRAPSTAQAAVSITRYAQRCPGSSR
ncbi:hypothetical protein LGM35_05470 [Burkholderia cenocepacia]|nr:hypothetical protein [Burkholderia cenocepacia]MCA7921925.1 hypothetical protein [Burkholderia cenocepacia]